MADATTASTTSPETTQQETRIARPLHVLTPLIAKDLREGREAAEQAGMPFYRAAGEKLLEAKVQIQHGNFEDWVKRNFKISTRTAREYMSLARTTADVKIGTAVPFSSLNDFRRRFEFADEGITPSKPRKSPYPTVSAEEVQRFREDAQRRQEEREACARLGLELIKRGYKSLAAELHPDKNKKGGSSEAMGRLNRVRDRLRTAV